MGWIVGAASLAGGGLPPAPDPGVPVPSGAATILWDTRAGQAQDIQIATSLADALSKGACSQTHSNCTLDWAMDVGNGQRGFLWTTVLPGQNDWQIFKNPHWHGRQLIYQSIFYCPSGFDWASGHKTSVVFREGYGGVGGNNARITTYYGGTTNGHKTYWDPQQGQMQYTTLTGTPTTGETLSFSPSGATATYAGQSSTGPSVLYTNVTGTPAAGDTITGQTSACVFGGATTVQAVNAPNSGSVNDARQHGGSFAGEIWASDGWGTVLNLDDAAYIGFGVRTTERWTLSSGPNTADGRYERWIEGNGLVTKVFDLGNIRMGDIGFGETQLGGPTWVSPPKIETWYMYDFRMWGEP